MRINAFHRLYQHRLSISTKPFNARGAKVVRCQYCQISTANCICEFQPNIETQVATMLLVSDNEVLKPSNTGHLIVDVVKESYVYQWNRTEPDEEMLALLNNESYQPVVIFPEEYVDDRSRVIDDMKTFTHQLDLNKKLLLIFLDGSWREARKMFRRSDYLHACPVLSIRPDSVSQYLMRKSENEQHLSTAEVASLVLSEVNETKAADSLSLWFEVFKESYMLSKTRYKSDLTRPFLQKWLEFTNSK
ncbi:DTW domain-containing protein [Vibrio sp. 10N.286.49.B3]|uniref:tRNA-uridine aminocarboxypropyltransferase n=1 Tax=Vibrio sp. 10N.286.49.B3 TaxID=1880855 RepID=UPI000C835368|nr:tRNA-uridine aminocarboxypropyltransferase [Vibrio sp. 10N.286.49.B3]PMH44928.1 DTW domain-containing protein [Vibrio sp. 10N.286.49.B3]